MALHNIQGKEGEDRAAKYLQDQGYTLLHRNWRSGHKELDIVAEKDNVLVFVEVKTRKNTFYGSPADAVNDKKIRRIVDSADAYIRHFKLDYPRVRFDLISVVTQEEETCRLEHIEDAFFPPVYS